MPITDDMVAAFRAYLSGDLDGWQRRHDTLDRSRAARRACMTYLNALFVRAVQRRFTADAPYDQIVRFVAELRAADGERMADRVDPDAAERMIRQVLDPDTGTGRVGRDQAIGVRTGVISVIVAEQRLDGVGLDVFLGEARALADDMLGEVR